MGRFKITQHLTILRPITRFSTRFLPGLSRSVTMADQSSMDAIMARMQKKEEAHTIKPGELLGFHRPVNGYPEHRYPRYGGNRPRFANAIQDWNGTPLTLRERTMIAFMGEITDKPEWARKVFDEEIVGKWRKERAEKEEKSEPERALTEKMFDYVSDLQ